MDHLVALDGDSEVMRFINGGRPTSHADIATEILPAFFYNLWPLLMEGLHEARNS